MKFFASREAAASCLAATCRSACAYVLSEGGKVRHMVRSPALRDAHGWVFNGTPLSTGSVAAALRSGRGQSGSAIYGGDAWFEVWQDVELSESSVFIHEYDQTPTLLHCTDQDELDYLPRAGIPTARATMRTMRCSSHWMVTRGGPEADGAEARANFGPGVG